MHGKSKQPLLTETSAVVYSKWNGNHYIYYLMIGWRPTQITRQHALMLIECGSVCEQVPEDEGNHDIHNPARPCRHDTRQHVG